MKKKTLSKGEREEEEEKKGGGWIRVQKYKQKTKPTSAKTLESVQNTQWGET
jgi:hypothetical protein